MTRRILDYDPEARITTYHEYDDQTDKSHIIEVQDIEPFLKRAQALRNDDEYTKKGIKNELWHYAHIPNIIVEKMLREDGVNVFEKGQEKEVLRLLNTKYAKVKATRKKHC